MKKICRICKENKELTDYHKKYNTFDGYRSECKECIKDIQKKYKEAPGFKEKRKEYDKKRYDENRDAIIERKKEYNIENREKILENKKRYHNKPEVKERMKIYNKIYQTEHKDKYYNYRRKHPHIIAWRSVLYSTLKRLGTLKEGHTVDVLGYSALELKEHLEKLFTPGMTWENHGEWHVDHIIAVINFNSDSDIKEVCGLSNLQPLWSTTREIDGVIYEGNLNKHKN